MEDLHEKGGEKVGQKKTSKGNCHEGSAELPTKRV